MMENRVLPTLKSLVVLAACCALPALAPPAYAAPPADGAAASSVGTLKVTGTVRGAEVYVDNAPMGTATSGALELALDPGVHTVRIVADNYDPLVKKVTIEPGKTATIDGRLTAGGGTIEFQVDAPKAKLTLQNDRGETVSLRNQETWSLPVRLEELPPGNYSYRIQAPGREPDVGTFTFKPGKNLLIFKNMASSRGKIAITSEPSGASVWLDGQPVGQTPLELEGIPAARHVVRIEKEGMATIFRTLDTSDGSKGELEARLPEEGATLVIRTGASDATLLLEGQPFATGRRIRVPELERGLYAVQITAPGRKTLDSNMDVPPDGKIIYEAELVGPDEREVSHLDPVRPLYQSWAFWTATGMTAGAIASGGYFVWLAAQPEPAPEGDVVVELP